MKSLKVGVRISVLDEDISGIVKAIDGQSVVIETKDGFEMTFNRNEIVVDQGIPKDKYLEGIDYVIHSEINSKSKRKEILRPKKGALPPMEVDLHIEQLVNNHKSLSSYQILNIQMDGAKHKLEFAIRKKIQRIVFIHGIGEGVLRAELEFLIGRYEGLKCYDADYQKYGRGALEVYIPQSIMGV
ncbi:DNA mismatch repair protein MutS [Aureisphaera sp. CAU 1614]|uniref:DNA mismatch repair protein MutS n=1 Tax=Halomarinibacterium sedimenti TaxID=2857106 RepID=A0A9X1FRX0_9FLAO|nr:DNA mismatch repair protein MutS [Halomarinibacterium sedimenti]MBW2938954.1 DNA mismatch repair protein MutS [Halomarinibacterium sedimenti]